MKNILIFFITLTFLYRINAVARVSQHKVIIAIDGDSIGIDATITKLTKNKNFKQLLKQKNHSVPVPTTINTLLFSQLENNYKEAVDLFFNTKLKLSKAAFLKIFKTIDSGIINAASYNVRLILLKSLLYYARIKLAQGENNYFKDNLIKKIVLLTLELYSQIGKSIKLNEFPKEIIDSYKKFAKQFNSCKGVLSVKFIKVPFFTPTTVYIDGLKYVFHPGVPAKIRIPCGQHRINFVSGNQKSLLLFINIRQFKPTTLYIHNRFFAHIAGVSYGIPVVQWYKFLETDFINLYGNKAKISYIKITKQKNNSIISTLQSDKKGFKQINQYIASADKKSMIPYIKKTAKKGKWRKILPWTMFGVGACSIGTGAFFNISTNNYIDKQNQGQGNYQNKIYNYKQYSKISFITGGSLMVTSVILYYILNH